MQNPYTGYTEQALFAAMAKGEESAFAELFRLYHHRVYGLTLKLVKDQVAAEDLAQEVFVKLWESREKMVEVNDVKSYLLTMAANHTYNYLRKLLNEEAMFKRLTVLMEDRLAENADARALLRNSEQLVQEAVDRLPPQQQQVYRLSFFEGLPYAEIAEKLAISQNTVRNHLVAANRSVRKYLLDSQGYSPLFLLLLLLDQHG